jgi:hypothetical protein
MVNCKDMPICETVSVLAKQLEEQLSSVTPEQSRMLAILKEMPRYRQKGDLHSWSTDYKNSRNKNENSDPNFSAIELIYEIGRYNLSTEFDQEGTVRLYHIATAMLAKGNISISRDLDVSKW